MDNKFSSFRDHLLSSNPKEMKNLVESIRETEILMGNGIKKVEECEKESIKSTRRSIVASKNFTKGHTIKDEDLKWIRPNNGLNPGQEYLIIGKKLNRNISEGEVFEIDNLY